MKIKDVEKQVGISKANIRFYEEEGLIHPARNQENNYREYSETDVEQLQEIKKLDVYKRQFPKCAEFILEM